ncbi:hypothetical protein BST20_26135 [Mycobacterium branderi]|uniref:Uncharacterized protein n=1 Tax=Mycobacterium branderi TaxID=43348 RepID=A0AA91LS87_9MYCO|nr:hypothetical protein BST20_26135 [Mycobacterium branderi]
MNVRDGRRLFPAVELTTEKRPPKCYLNGPEAVLCVHDFEAVTAWVVDAHTGRVSYRGPTDLRTYPAKLGVHQVGIYAIALTENEGVYGVGPKADTTWFVPGAGHVDNLYPPSHDTAPPALATQVTGGRGSDARVVFSLSDGRVITPELDENAELQKTIVYPGGFAAEIADRQDRSVLTRVQFFDDAGKRTSRKSIHGDLPNIETLDLPVIEALKDWAVYTPDGGRLLKLTGERPVETRLIGTKFFFAQIGGIMGPHWQQYDLRTGAQGKTCDYDLGYGYYLGTDGTVAVADFGNPNVGRLTKAYDLSGCETLWTAASPVGSFHDLWRINTTLVQLSDDATELASLVAPH